MPNPQTFGYDELDRLTTYTTPSTNQSYTYDSDGNRLTHTVGATPPYTYTYHSTNNRLTNTGPTAKTYLYDAVGNITADGRNLFTYNARGRLTQVTYNTTSSNTYQINGLGQRVKKSGTGVLTGSTFFMYDEADQLIGVVVATRTDSYPI